MKKIFLEFRKIHRKTPVPDLFFNKVAGLKPFLTEHLWWLLLHLHTINVCVVLRLDCSSNVHFKKKNSLSITLSSVAAH